MEGSYSITFEFKDENGQSLPSGGSSSFQVKLIDNPCEPNLTSLNNMMMGRTFTLGDTDTITIDDTVVTNGNCKFDITLAEAECLTMGSIPVSTSPPLNNPMVSFTQTPFVSIPGEIDARMVEPVSNSI